MKFDLKTVILCAFVFAAFFTPTYLIAQGVTISKTDTSDNVKIDAPMPTVDSLPCDFISVNTLSVTSGSVVTIGTVPSTAKRAVVFAPVPVAYSWDHNCSDTYPMIASGGVKCFVGTASDLADLRFHSYGADAPTTKAFFFKK